MTRSLSHTDCTPVVCPSNTAEGKTCIAHRILKSAIYLAFKPSPVFPSISPFPPECKIRAFASLSFSIQSCLSCEPIKVWSPLASARLRCICARFTQRGQASALVASDAGPPCTAGRDMLASVPSSSLSLPSILSSMSLAAVGLLLT